MFKISDSLANDAFLDLTRMLEDRGVPDEEIQAMLTGPNIYGDMRTRLSTMGIDDEILRELDARFNVYDDVKRKLISGGIPAGEIAFIHDANTDAQKQELFDKVNAGRVRVILGSTEKMGSGTNIQQRLVEMHHLDAPWRPRDVEQREGRILRQGNLNPQVRLRRYATEESFDVYKWQILETKAKFIGSVMRGDLDTRSIEDADAVVLGYAEMKALATGNPVIIDKIKTENELKKLYALRRAHQDRFFTLQQENRRSHKMVEHAEGRTIPNLQAAQQRIAVGRNGDDLATIGDRTYTAEPGKIKQAKEAAGAAFLAAYDRHKGTYTESTIGTIRGCPIVVKGDGQNPPKVTIQVTPDVRLPIEVGLSPAGNMSRLQNALDGVPTQIRKEQQAVESLRAEIAARAKEMEKPFEHKAKVEALETKLAGLAAQIEEIEKGAPKQATGEEE